MSEESIPFQKVAFHCPPLDEVATVLQKGLSKDFEDVEVRVVDCPDLTKSPFNLAAPGLCGQPQVADVGGVPYISPLPNFEKKYNLHEIARLCGVPDALVVGAGAGPWHVVGVNSEMMPNVKFGGDKGKDFINTHVCKIKPQDGSYELLKLTSISKDCVDGCLLMNLFVSEGKPGKVLEVKASKRSTPSMNFMKSMRLSLAKHYGDKPVALGGTFCVEKGKCKLHVMPDFSKTPLTCDEDFGTWLKFFEMDAPLTALGYLVSHDPDLDLRIEHFHCFSSHGDGGHYHYDTTPATVAYRGYFSVAEHMVRIDRPKETHNFGRD